jgi:aminoglycoside phosphotransferase (APT) family kinase protein
MTLEDNLPAELCGPDTSITQIAAGLSGAGVHRVATAGGRTFVLKTSGHQETLDRWRDRLQIQRLAAGAGLAPRVVHADEERRSVVTEFVVDRSFAAFYMEPGTHEAALARLGGTIRRLHALEPPVEMEAADPVGHLRVIATALAGFAVPSFVAAAIERVLSNAPPVDRPLVLSHNDVNPTNLVWDGDRLLLLDWDTAAPNDAFYDLASVAVFLRMDDAKCQKLLASYGHAPTSDLPPGFRYNRRLVAALCGAAFLQLARKNGHAGASETDTLDAVPSLAGFYRRMRSGALRVANSEGQWCFGLALVKTSIELEDSESKRHAGA